MNSSEKVTLSVLAPPTVRMNYLTVTVNEGDSLSLTCTANIPDTGHPLEKNGVDFTWWNDKTEITDKNGKHSHNKGLYCCCAVAS